MLSLSKHDEGYLVASDRISIELFLRRTLLRWEFYSPKNYTLLLMKKPIKCFVACAFGRSDVDKIFSKGILPVLKELKIIPLRVDRINHNKNIDQKIIELIKSCDIGIADLTYARPSVYYEAGYINGLNKEVIFTARKDHFRPIDVNDESKKIHFDLITKNIISWESPNEIFKRKLKQRVQLISNPIIKKSVKEEKIVEQEKNFSALPLKERQNIISDLSKKIISKYGYKSFQKYLFTHNGIKGSKNNLQLLGISTYGEVTKKQLESLNFWISIDSESAQASLITIILNSLKSVNVNLVHKVFPSFRKNPDKKEFSTYPNDQAKRIHLIIIDNIKSPQDYINRINELIL